MVKKTITYTDFNGVQRTEEHLFNLTRSELMEMEVSTSGGMSSMLERIIAAQDQPSLFKIFKDFVLKAYGEKSPDGRRFIKSEELSTAFSQTGAYDQLMQELLSSDENAAAFINSFVPDAPSGDDSTPAPAT